jgi:hypothetical protein
MRSALVDVGVDDQVQRAHPGVGQSPVAHTPDLRCFEIAELDPLAQAVAPNLVALPVLWGVELQAHSDRRAGHRGARRDAVGRAAREQESGERDPRAE